MHPPGESYALWVKSRPHVSDREADVASPAPHRLGLAASQRCFQRAKSINLAISTAIDPDILLIDEILGAGDDAFMKKAGERMTDLIQRSKILVLASHAPAFAERFCDRALWLDNGEIRQDGPLKQVLAAYLQASPTLSQMPISRP
jgi:ABC-type sulfate/molybdate transport systems ATPase subunit